MPRPEDHPDYGALDFTIVGGQHLAEIVKALEAVGNGELASELKSALRKASRPMVPKVRQAIDRIPSNHDGTLRGEMKKATHVQFRSSGREAGITVRVDGRRMPAHKRTLPAYMEGTKPRWRHPVYGNPEVWVQQPDKSFFYKTVTPFGVEVKKDIDAVAERIAKKLTP